MTGRPRPRHYISLSLFCVLTTGCLSMPKTGAPVAFQSYDLPGSLGSTTVIHAVERAFTRTLAAAPQIIEGSVSYPLPARPAFFTVEDRRVHLKGLGVVTIREVGCPGSLASVRAWVTDRSEFSGLRRYTGCIQPFAGAYRVYLVDSRVDLNDGNGATDLGETGETTHPKLLSRLAEALQEQLKNVQGVTGSGTIETFPSGRQAYEKIAVTTVPSSGERAPSISALPERTASHVAPGATRAPVTMSPLVCLVPRYGAAAVRTRPGRGKVIQLLEQGTLVAVAEPVDAAYFQVETTEGLAGWVNRSEVKRLSCPIG